MRWKYVLLTGIVWLSYLIINYLNYFRDKYYDISVFIDGYIPLISLMIIPYLLAIPFMLLPFLLSKDEKSDKKIFYSFSFIILISDLIFLLLPTKMIRPETGDLLLNLFYGLEMPHNLFPSLHVSAVTLTQMISINLDKRMKKIIWLSILIIISTLFVKQHYVLDIIGGLMVGFLGYLFYRKI